MRVSMRDGGMGEALRDLGGLDAERVATACTFELARRAKALAPYDTGGLVASLRAEVDGGCGRVGFLAEHAPHVEYGHRQNVGQFVPAIGKRLRASYVPGQHFFRRAVDETRATMAEAVRGAIGGAP